VFCKPQSIPIYVFICSKLENIEKSYDCRFHTATFPVTTLFSRYNFSKLTNLRLLEELYLYLYIIVILCVFSTYFVRVLRFEIIQVRFYSNIHKTMFY
jgi:hypothetical protein